MNGGDKEIVMSKLKETAAAIRRAVTGGKLSVVPVYLVSDAQVSTGHMQAGTVAWVERPEADRLVLSRAGVIWAACSITRPCRSAQGGTLHVESTVAAQPFEHAERLEADGFLRILRDDSMLATHQSAWSEASARQSADLARARQMHREWIEFARQANSATRYRPVISWGDEPAQQAS